MVRVLSRTLAVWATAGLASCPPPLRWQLAGLRVVLIGSTSASGGSTAAMRRERAFQYGGEIRFVALVWVVSAAWVASMQNNGEEGDCLGLSRRNCSCLF